MIQLIFEQLIFVYILLRERAGINEIRNTVWERLYYVALTSCTEICCCVFGCIRCLSSFAFLFCSFILLFVLDYSQFQRRGWGGVFRRICIHSISLSNEFSLRFTLEQPFLLPRSVGPSVHQPACPVEQQDTHHQLLLPLRLSTKSFSSSSGVVGNAFIISDGERSILPLLRWWHVACAIWCCGVRVRTMWQIYDSYER